MQISPWASIALNVLYAVLASLTIPVVDSLGFAAHDAQIVTWAGIGLLVLNVVLHAFSSSTPGPAAPADPPVVQAATVVANLPQNAPTLRVQLAKSMARQAVEDHQP
jgi:hypothetical protein